jgi:hypothetical protein
LIVKKSRLLFIAAWSKLSFAFSVISFRIKKSLQPVLMPYLTTAKSFNGTKLLAPFSKISKYTLGALRN